MDAMLKHLKTTHRNYYIKLNYCIKLFSYYYIIQLLPYMCMCLPNIHVSAEFVFKLFRGEFQKKYVAS